MTFPSPGPHSPAVLVIDGARRILFRDEQAERLVGTHPALKERRGCLEWNGSSEGAPAIQRLLLPGARPLLALMAPVREAAYLDDALLILIWDPASLRTSVGLALCELYGLTEAELLTALATYQGKTPAEIAEERCRSVNTVRTLLNRVLQKCGVKRQAQLVRLMADLASTCELADGIHIGMGISPPAFDAARCRAVWRDAGKTLAAGMTPSASVEAVACLHDFSPGARTTRHYHTHGHEVICVLDGALATEFANDVAEITSKNRARYIGPRVVHRGYNPNASKSLRVLSINVTSCGTSSRVDLPS